MAVAAILLAAGLSRRFGDTDKIAAALGGMALGRHAARSLAELDLAARFVVTGDRAMDWPGFAIVGNDRPGAGMAHSIGLGVAAAALAGADAVLIALADMPFVPVAHFQSLLSHHHGPASLAASGDGRRRLPPALFGSDHFPALKALRGDQGARDLIGRAVLVPLSAELLLDIDRPADLLAAARLVAS